jgi:leader peptidase (prepilin peptidase) / N-methyltransferase
MELSHILFIALSAVIGLMVGGIVNWLSDDLPHTFAVRPPHYPDGTSRPRRAWLGLAAFLGGKRMAPSGSRLPWRHPITEIVTAFLFLVAANAFGLSGKTFYLWGCLFILVLITVIDLEHRIILVAVIVLGILYALLGAWLARPWEKIQFTDHLWGMAGGFLVFLLMYLGGWLFNKLSGAEETAFGYGDVLLAALSGAILGWQALIFAVMITIFAGGAGALLYVFLRYILRRRYDVYTALPYGQYIVFGTLVMMLWRTPVIQFLQLR